MLRRRKLEGIKREHKKKDKKKERDHKPLKVWQDKDYSEMKWNESDFDEFPPFDTSTDSADWFSNCDFFKYFPL